MRETTVPAAGVGKQEAASSPRKAVIKDAKGQAVGWPPGSRSVTLGGGVTVQRARAA